MLRLALALTAGALQAGSIALYLRDVLARRARPNAVSWLLWTGLQGLALGIQVGETGPGLPTVFLGLLSVGTAAVALLAVAGYGAGRPRRLDLACLVLAAGAAGLWTVAAAPLAALGLVVLADGFASLPTLVKTWRDPASERPGPWLLLAVAAACGSASSPSLAAADIGFPAYLAALSLLVGGLALRRSAGRPGPGRRRAP